MAAPFPLSDRASDVRPGCKTQRVAPTSSRLDVRSHQRKRVFHNMYCWTRELLPPVFAYAYRYLYNRAQLQRDLARNVTLTQAPYFPLYILYILFPLERHQQHKLGYSGTLFRTKA
ncbi:hypothetical protein PoB_000599900 [Plakobranchus ocellatus]|uniref:Uncharacterized protein n=1 Tax=Plakobranchus ocellatus TaxID=259542 RepID=A0AAV3YBM4_9GAST|nr:hypothetical protein PoB_000599900 [Plakobranchus ocellatus]